MADESKSFLDKVGDEFTTQTTLNPGAKDDEAHPSTPEDPAALAAKMKAETGEGDGIVDKAKRAWNEFDRDISGEYEAREQATVEDRPTDHK